MSNIEYRPIGMTDEQFEKRRPNTEGRARIVGHTPWREGIIHGVGAGGAVKKKASWKEYYSMYRGHAIVRAAIDKIADTATAGTMDYLPRNTRAPTKQIEVDFLKEFIEGQPNFIGELRRVYKDLLIYGDAFLYIVPNRRREPVKLKRIAPNTIQVKCAQNGQVQAYYQTDPLDLRKDALEFQPHEFIHIKIDDPDNDIYGLAPLESLRWAVSADLFAQRFNASFFMNSGVTGTVIAIKTGDSGELQRNRKWIEENYSGPDAAHKILVLEGEGVTVQRSVATHNEMGFLEGRKFIIMEILAVLKMQPAKLGMMETANRSNAKEQDKTFRSESIVPLQNIVEDAINNQFVRPILGVEDTVIAHSRSDARDAMEAMEYFTKAISFGILSPDEVRDEINKPKVAGGDIHGMATPVGFVPLDQIPLIIQLQQEEVRSKIRTQQDQVKVAEEQVDVQRESARAARSSAAAKRPVSKYESDAIGGMIQYLGPAMHDMSSLRKAYAYAVDAGSVDPVFADASALLKRACDVADDEFLRQGYVERAAEAVKDFLREIVHEQP